uniref:Yolk protein 3 n=1 Tax=Glossina morsitans morsitans TaxID=37546 RepID=Q2PZ00_GLOMM|nr:yolk protein 3 [Glossina morsitans morsitans]
MRFSSCLQVALLLLFLSTCYLNALPSQSDEYNLSELVDRDSDYDQDDEVDIDAINNFLKDEEDDDEWCEWLKCDNDLRQPKGFRRYVDVPFIKKILKNLNPFSKPELTMKFYLFKQDFRDCGREIGHTDDSFYTRDLDNSIPTRILIHGWMSQSRGSFNRDVKNAYLSHGDYNVIICDWSNHAANINYFHVVHLIETFGTKVAEFTHKLHEKVGIDYDDIYLIGHSLGAQIAGAAGKRLQPHRYNTIFALDPAGPKFRRRTINFRIDPTDANYVETIQTSRLGFVDPTGNATFYPNFGLSQKNCLQPACSHTRSYKFFAESIISTAGFWGIRCNRSMHYNWECDKSIRYGEYPMGGDPSIQKSGIFYVETNDKQPFALGRLARFLRH